MTDARENVRECPGQSWRELLEDNERLRTEKAEAVDNLVAGGQQLQARIEAALALLAEAKDTTEQRWRIVKALKGGK